MVFNALAATLIKGWPSRLWHGTSGAGDLPERARRLFLLKLHKLRMPCHDKRRAALSDPRSLAGAISGLYRVWGVPKIGSILLGDHMDYTILGSILGSPYLGRGIKLDYRGLHGGEL